MVATLDSPTTTTPAAEPAAPRQPRTLSSTYANREPVDVTHDDLKEANYNPAVAYATASARRAIERHSARTESAPQSPAPVDASDDSEDDELDDEVGVATIDGQRVKTTVTDSAGRTVRGEEGGSSAPDSDSGDGADPSPDATLDELRASALQLVEKLPESSVKRLKGKTYNGATPIESFRMWLDDYYEEVRTVTARSARREATQAANAAHEEEERERRARQRARQQSERDQKPLDAFNEAMAKGDILGMNAALSQIPDDVWKRETQKMRNTTGRQPTRKNAMGSASFNRSR